MTAVGANHARALVAAFSEVDKLLGEIEVLATPNTSPFARIKDDLTPSQHDEIHSHARYIREQLVQGLNAVGIAIRTQGASARGPILTRLSFAEIALRESDPKELRSYGSLSPDAEVTLERILADLLRAVRAMRRALEVDPSQGFAERLARLEKTPVDLALLGKLQEIVTRRGFVELRGLLEALVEQLENPTFEVAIFGHVSSGKSSLLNAILGLDLLPVGITPVTAVPTRIEAGDDTLVRVSFAGGSEEKTVPTAELASFVSEAENPANTKRVRRVTVVVQSDRLPKGIALVDTPGVGTLATSGARETFTYLPRCDLGVVLLDPAGSLSADDIRLLLSLRNSAIPSLLVVSKADLVAPTDHDRLSRYVCDEIRKATGLEPSLSWVSNLGPSANAREWFASQIEPLLRRAHESADASSRRKLGQLRESVVATLRAMRGEGEVSSGARAEVDRIAGEAERALQKCRSRCDDLAMDASELIVPIVKLATVRFAETPVPERAANDILRAAMLVMADGVRSKLSDEIVRARDLLLHALSEMADAAESVASEESLHVDFVTMPVLRIPREVERFALSASWTHLAPGRRKFRDRVVRDLAQPISRALSDFRQELRAWLAATVERLSEQFAGAAGPIRARVRKVASGEGGSFDDDLHALGVES